ncbi:hypothetical protein Pla108_11870 [Botrimarina colliarenosi]|uniref:Uncharacterized protein n=1 Tax=Botrimarina colliarenosi TaxID=2528001 RepID=A0A5C6AKQ2_9BACT|nr:hypothetical protein [Botrimarina colliarenosi]TWU00240.1 hypothetical protein Pla108_11870 [Botrimarina colliarenosi]
MTTALLLAAIDWGSVAWYLCIAVVVGALLVMTGGSGPKFPNDLP